MPTPIPSQELLLRLLTYEQATGKLYWKRRTPELMGDCEQVDVNRWNTRYAGQEAFIGRHVRGYRVGVIHGKTYRAHRIIYKMFHGTEPNEIDHINGDTSDNRIENLREVSHSENGKNARMSARNTSGVTGVSWRASIRKWIARIRVDRQLIALGTYAAFEDAVSARLAAEQKYGFHHNHGRYQPAHPSQELATPSPFSTAEDALHPAQGN